MTRAALLVTHTGRPDVVELAREVAGQLGRAGFEVRVPAHEAKQFEAGERQGLGAPAEVRAVPADDRAAAGAEIVIALGGDGTFLRAVELAYPVGVPLLGVNLGHVGFLAEAEPDALTDAVRNLVARRYAVEERLTLDVSVIVPGQPPSRGWALNEASLEKATRERMLDIELEVDGRPLTSFGCDGVLCATPTGSTAYAFSAGGPVVWPKVEALLVVPNAAHALFARPLVISPDSTFAAVIADRRHDGLLSCDGRRTMPVPSGGRVEVRRGSRPVRIARLHAAPFTDRLVAKFQLPVRGFRNRYL